MCADYSKTGKRNRAKGSRFELRVRDLFKEKLGVDLVRNLEQTRGDIYGDLVEKTTMKGPFMMSIECKAREFTLNELITANQNSGPIYWMVDSYNKVSVQDYQRYLTVFRDQKSNLIYSLLYVPYWEKEFFVPDTIAVWVLCKNVFLSTFEDMLELVKWNFCKQQTT